MYQIVECIYVSLCLSLKDITPLEKWKFNVSNFIDFSCMFLGCSSLSNIKALEKWDVSKCNNLCKCIKL